jgi:hypothetical protein
MDVEYYNTVNQLSLVNNWFVSVKLHNYYVKTNSELIDNSNITNYYIKYGFNDWNEGAINAAKENHLELIKFFIEKGAKDYYYYYYYLTSSLDVEDYIRQFI